MKWISTHSPLIMIKFMNHSLVILTLLARYCMLKLEHNITVLVNNFCDMTYNCKYIKNLYFLLIWIWISVYVLNLFVTPFYICTSASIFFVNTKQIHFLLYCHTICLIILYIAHYKLRNISHSYMLCTNCYIQNVSWLRFTVSFVSLYF